MASINNVGSNAGLERWNASQAEDSAGDEFSGAVAAADLVAAQSGRKTPVATAGGAEGANVSLTSAGMKAASDTAAGNVPHQELSPENGKVETRSTGKIDRSIPKSAGGGPEVSSLIQKMAVSSNTGADIAGLKPWSPDWVFEGGMNKHPLQKTMIEDPSRGGSAGALNSLEKLLQEANATMAGTPDELKTSAEKPLSGEKVPSQPGMKSLTSSDFLDVRQAMQAQSGAKPLIAGESVPERHSAAVARQVKGVVGTEQALAVPGAGLQAPNAIGESAEIKGKKPKILDTVGLINPQQGKAEMGSNVIPFQAGPQTLKMDGAVVPGSLSQNRLSSESVSGITQNIRHLSNGGEMRIRLKPDHLGELHLKVMTGGKAGSEVGLQIHASDERAKRILEESMGSLREGLASQNLSLAKVDVQIAQPSSSQNSGNDPNQDRPGLQGQQNFSSNSGNSGGRGNSTQDGSSRGETGSALGNQPVSNPRQAKAWSGGGSNRAVASNRLDVIA